MTAFIKLTAVGHGDFHVRADQIHGVVAENGSATIAFGAMRIVVAEAPDVILAAIAAADVVTDEMIFAAASEWRARQDDTGTEHALWRLALTAALRARRQP